jgi:hypothetical protein
VKKSIQVRRRMDRRRATVSVAGLVSVSQQSNKNINETLLPSEVRTHFCEVNLSNFIYNIPVL